MKDQECIFCKIIARELKGTILDEDEHTMTIVPIEPINKGHALVIPKDHYKDLFDIPPAVLEKIVGTSQRVGKKLCAENVATGLNLLHASGSDAQQSVFHFHMHVVPRYPEDGLDLWFKVGIEKR